ncbi:MULTISPECIES: CdaR family transcriptional regulator [Pseudonocardia]|uniref:DNA-binding transcriptional regulator, PucR family n=1 Tax=Pseudonocardia oroxyli TaxID=366584 RepID=A0A1G7JUN8_PSEOR|nr:MULTISPECIES: helix-turn-helix domain-containing protein [Pseudonocardia]MCF7549969.1 helix-turn-helix domain-containing protein [Pseudonocardia sp. WMMC193]SDF28638.1 DNA-binding transcriptional regulator, PucR family [Pseudonocardia oroxyli]
MTLSDVQAVSAATLRRLERATGDLAAACLSAMEDGQPWFARLPADQRAGVLLVTQTGISNFVAWFGEPGETMRLTAEAFRIAPKDLARRLSLRQTVDLVRIATEVMEERLPPLAADEPEYRTLVEAVLRFGREIAFAAATVYANAAETRGAWDARQEALVVDGVIRGETDDALVSRAATIGWDPGAAVRVMVGSPPEDGGEEAAEVLSEMRRHATRLGRQVLVGVQGSRLVLLLTEPRGRAAGDPDRALAPIVADFGPGPVVVGPVAANLAAAHASALAALAGLRAAPGWPDAPRPVDADELLPERAVAGDPTAVRGLVESVVAPVEAAGGELLRTLAAYLEGGGSLEGCARALFVHPNTVRYRLRRVSELTGRSATDPRDAHVLRTALLAGRLAEPGSSP